MMSRKQKHKIRLWLVVGIVFFFIGIPSIHSAVVHYQKNHKADKSTREITVSGKQADRESDNASKERAGSGRIIKYAQVTDIDSPEFYMYDKILYSENGDVYDYFTRFDKVNISLSYDHKQAAITADGTLYYVDGNLDPVLICGRTQSYGIMCKDGGYILYCSDINNAVKVYDVANNEHIKVNDGLIKDSKYAISSNGKYVTLFHQNKTRIIPYGQQAVTSPVSDEKLFPIAISDDGTRAFYYDTNKYSNKTWVYSYHDGELHQISVFEYDNQWSFIVNDDCTDLFIYGRELWYYSNRNDKLRRVLGNSPNNFYFSKENLQVIEGPSRVRTVDVPSLEGCFIDAYMGDYWFYDAHKDAISLAEDDVITYFNIHDREMDYLLIKDDHVYKGNVKTNHKVENEFIELEYKTRDFVANKDLSTVWLIDTDNGLHKYQDYHMYDFGEVSDSTLLKYVPCEKKVYYISDSTVYSLDENTEEITTVSEKCRTRTYLSSDYGDFAGFTDLSGRRVASVYGNLTVYK